MTLLYFLEPLCYSALFMFLSIHSEMASLLSYKQDPSLTMSNVLTNFWQTCGLFIAAIVMLLLGIVSFVLIILSCKSDLYNTAVRSAMTVKGIACLLLFPGALFALLNDTRYGVVLLLTVITIQLLVGQIVCIVRLLHTLRRKLSA